MKLRSAIGGLLMAMTGMMTASACEPSAEDVLMERLGTRARLVAEGASAEALAEFDRRLDAYAGQKDAWTSRLYWHRDLESAKAEAAASGRPILSLRLLGTLDCDLSCANSRFFRTVLYANRELSAFLRESFVLHWQSVRPVPVVTIDMGDGRVLKRTVTGNSIHYVLSAEGQVVDALPGLYGPARFREQLERARLAVHAGRKANDMQAAIRRHLTEREAGLKGERIAWLASRGGGQRNAPQGWESLDQGQGAWSQRDDDGQPGDLPSAADAAPLAMGKAMVEGPLVRATTGEDPFDPFDMGAALGRVRLDAGSRALMATKLAPAQRATVAAFEAAVAEFEAVIARDQTQNELELRPRILQRLSTHGEGLDALNTWVYAEVFLTPDRDPWLGLDAGGAYAALDAGGVLDH